MKCIKKITGLVITLALTINAGGHISYAQEALTEPEKACKGKKPVYTKLLEGWNEEETKNQSAYENAFEEAQDAHHDYVGCMFGFAEGEIMKSDGAGDAGTMTANLGNLSSIPIIGGLIDWMSPDQACLEPEDLKKVIEKSEPSQMLGPILQAHTDYKNHLHEIGNEFDSDGVITNSKGEALPSQLQMLSAKSAILGTLKRRRQMEIDSSLMVIDLMFTSLKELRLAFVMHVHFQCTIKFLGKYRRALEDLRNVIEPLPVQLEDASIS